MKKFSLFLVFVFSFFVGSGFESHTYASCVSSIDNVDMKTLDKCKPNNAVGINDSGNLSINNGKDLNKKVTKWTQTIAMISALGAVGVLVYAGMLMQFSGGNDDTINKAKEIIKVTLIGTAIITVAGGIVYLVITMIFGIAGT